jgi:pyrroloquinoline quinone biosynthesis protein B
MKLKIVMMCIGTLVLFGFLSIKKSEKLPLPLNLEPAPYIVVLGIAQDGGYPQAGCTKECCAHYYSGKAKKHYVSCIGLIDPATHQRWLFDATPDFIMQLHYFDSIAPYSGILFNGIFLTHAHIGHYTGLMNLGKEAMNTQHIPVYAMPRMKQFLKDNGPWSQLVSIGNIDLKSLKDDSTIQLSSNISVTPFLVPHRDEFSETVGYRIITGNKRIIFIPDIDKWDRWKQDILKVIQDNDLVFIDGTFFKDGELSNTTMRKVPHPFIEESMNLFSGLSIKDKEKIYFIHLNHTNPALYGDSNAVKEIESNHFHLAQEGMIFN